MSRAAHKLPSTCNRNMGGENIIPCGEPAYTWYDISGDIRSCCKTHDQPAGKPIPLFDLSSDCPTKIWW